MTRKYKNSRTTQRFKPIPYKFKELLEQVNDSMSQFLAQSPGDEIFDFMLSNRSQSERTAMHSWLGNLGLFTQVIEVLLIFGPPPPLLSPITPLPPFSVCTSVAIHFFLSLELLDSFVSHANTIQTIISDHELFIPFHFVAHELFIPFIRNAFSSSSFIVNVFSPKWY